ncbi:ABC transporter permease [Latilactobacillus fuchuensis]|uniref:ABC transporter permease n=1 Tax=Latilactobacillus fuchuensis TaxID=164393 RepID=UPI0020C7EDB3|nr:ABC transporter permease [Latilactobacillus fuchuensis]MCP8857042.1 ABC transporter permease [Latilactobacillus fuchuensis]
MRFSEVWRTALRSILKNKRRSILTMLGIVIGIASVVAILAIGDGFSNWVTKSITNNKAGKVETQIMYSANDVANTSSQPFNERDLMLVGQVSGVAKVKQTSSDDDYAQISLAVKNKTKSVLVHYTAGKSSSVLVGRRLRTADNQIGNQVAVIDADLASSLYGSQANALHHGVEVDGQLYEIVGISKAVNDSVNFSAAMSGEIPANITIPRKVHQSYTQSQRTGDLLTLSLAKGSKASKVNEQVLHILKTQGSMHQQGDYQSNDPTAQADTFGKVLNAITYFVSAVAGISLFIAGIGVMNMMYISVAERTTEIGIRRAMGARQQDIRRQFLLESATLTIFGGFVGYGLGVLLALAISALPIMPFHASFSFGGFALAFGVSTVVGLVFGVMPANAASRKDLIEIIR